MPRVRLIAIDIDGTLLDPQFQVSAANLKALRQAHNLGVEIALVTGRRHSFALPVAGALGFNVTLISSNGAVTRSSSGELFYQDLLPHQTAAALIQHMTAFRNNLVLTFDREVRGALVVESVEELNIAIQRWMEKNAEYVERIRPIERSLTEDPIQAMFCGTIARMEEAQAHLLAASDLLRRITVLKTQYQARDLCIVDVLNQGCSKGHALRRWAEHFSIPRERIMAIGDNYNDVEMLEFAGIPVIMGNASDDLKKPGWTITLGNDESGVAHAIEKVLSE